MDRRTFVAKLAKTSVAISAIPATSQLVNGCATSPSPIELVINDESGSLARTEAPVCAAAHLSDDFARAVFEDRVVAREVSIPGESGVAVPVQVLSPAEGRIAWLSMLLPRGRVGPRRFALLKVDDSLRPVVKAQFEPSTQQYLVSESGKPVLRYNYATVAPGKILDSVAPDNLKYSAARSNYIHPLWGPNGEELTKDWSVDHPHHRGIYWAWPEVDWRGQRGDLHALQLVFARPTGHCTTVSGPVFAQIDAENVWKWQDKEEIVRERAIIRVWRKSVQGRLVDLEFHFTALQDQVFLARRGTDKYGGLNLRFGAVQGQKNHIHVSPGDAKSSPSWADVSGLFPGAPADAGVTILQSPANPDYPGDWIEYPELNWLQPTFPAAGTRYALQPGKSLVLRFRLWIHPGSTPTSQDATDHWRAANTSFSLPTFL